MALHLTDQRPSRSLFLMELAAAQQPLCDVGGLKRRTLGRRMGRKVARHRNQNMPARIGVAPFAELPHACLQHLVGVEARILTEQSVREGRDQRVGRVAEREMARDQSADHIDLPLAIERLQQGRADGPDVGREGRPADRRLRLAAAPAAR